MKRALYARVPAKTKTRRCNFGTSVAMSTDGLGIGRVRRKESSVSAGQFSNDASDPKLKVDIILVWAHR